MRWNSSLFLAEGGGRGGAAHDADKRGESHQVGERIEQEGTVPFDAEPGEFDAADLQLGLDGVEEAEEERAERRAERVPFAEDNGGQRDIALADILLETDY